MAKDKKTGTGRGTAPPRGETLPDDDTAASAAADPADALEEGGASSTYLVPGLERGLRILAEFSAREPVLGAPELSKRIGIPRTTTFRLLQTLEALGFLERANGDRHFRLGVAVLRLGFEYLSSLELTDFGTPVLERLRDATGLSTHLLIRDERDVVFVAKAQTHDPMFSSVKVHVGTRLPAHATVHGQVLMGDMTLADLKALYAGQPLERFTDRTPDTVEDLYARVRESAAQGYAISEASFERGISVVSAPVRDQSGRIVAAITATVPRSDIGDDERVPLIAAVCGAAIDLSARLNYRPHADDPTAAHARNKPVAAG
ncbi:IclR family transcriptional regulator [Paraburkholderia caballeronis]|uniref:DNA-binding transcriptional regulator, IclR family n=1 Tax=Paraburkholderia caballeronis TaxID=416943 RepID=A0A1H7LCY3_9BURK|nr:IclR family transcriptional regulator [Paraburkholderia caballeronis]PXW28384.1 IclR family transcriptional regulator [Paraburkholderia caballeronis]PXX03750.1 IclR family transcriptional regulator [Paraburkholderia caballeronis]RAK04494.1 IclR family transcriptional regulator [Paraburkholderia caballeronis]TDV19399.1 IclR family transcriptional regulator [Paraburkholderia caballeronis]TDV21999.1 IclR family transcriptional regulator [Paraburkholderia caballeronis]